MRMIDADKCPCNDCVSPLGDSRGCSIFPCREFGEWYKNTTYDVDKVVEEICNIEIGGDCRHKCEHYDWSVGACQGICEDYVRNCAINIVKRGGVDEN